MKWIKVEVKEMWHPEFTVVEVEEVNLNTLIIRKDDKTISHPFIEGTNYKYCKNRKEALQYALKHLQDRLKRIEGERAYVTDKYNHCWDMIDKLKSGKYDIPKV